MWLQQAASICVSVDISKEGKEAYTLICMQLKLNWLR